jgi:hypothetical protein
MVALRGVLAVTLGVILASLVGIGFEASNSVNHWVEPAYGYMYFYPWLALAGGVLGAAIATAGFARWNRIATAGQPPSPTRAVFAGITGAWWAFVFGVLFDYANGYFGWLSPATTFPYAYTAITALGGLLGSWIAVGSYARWHLAAPQAANGGKVKAAAAKTMGAARAAAPAGKGYTSARQQSAGFADVPGMPLGDFKSALDGGKDAKAKE